MPNLVSLTRPSLQLLSKTQPEFFSDFRISGQSLIKENRVNSRTSNIIDMKLGPATKLNKRIGDDVMSENYDLIVNFFDLWPIWSNPEAGFRTHSL